MPSSLVDSTPVIRVTINWFSFETFKMLLESIIPAFVCCSHNTNEFELSEVASGC